MGIQGAVRSDKAARGGGDPPPEADKFAFGADGRRFQADALDEAHVEFEGRVGLPERKGTVHAAAPVVSFFTGRTLPE